MKYVKGEYIDNVIVLVDGEERMLHVWRNPETKNIFAVDHMDGLPAHKNGVPDPYTDGTFVVFEDTFTGLPK